MTPRLRALAPVTAMWLFVGAMLIGCGPTVAQMAAAQGRSALWRPHDVELEAAGDHAWWEFPVRGIFRHDTGGKQVGPVFLSEASYELASDAENAYHARWQIWSAFLNGAAGYGWAVPGRPDPAEDWVLLVQAESQPNVGL